MEYSYKIATINIANISNATKIDALRSFVRSADLDLIFLQEVQNDSLLIPGFNIIFNVDIQQRGTAIATKDLYKIDNIEKSLDSRIISVRISGVTFINIYAPLEPFREVLGKTFSTLLLPIIFNMRLVKLFLVVTSIP